MDAVGDVVAVPTGTVVFWFSDIEGSTERWERFGDAMGAAVRRHDAIVRAAIGAHGGYVFKTIGDAFCAAFAAAGPALAAAIAVQRELAATDWSAVGGMRVRLALHAGAAEVRDGDYFGPIVNRTARLLAVAHGGQTVLSEAVAELVRDALPPGAALRGLGSHRLKDLTAPEIVAQLDLAGLPNDFPPLRSLDPVAHNLPAATTPLLGRDEDLARVAGLVATHAVVTVVGAGGVGKTRVALAVGAAAVGRFPDGVWFVDLAPLADEALVASTVARELRIRESPGVRALDALVATLAGKRLALVLDNCEHVVGGVAHVVEACVRASADVRVLATSREPLRVAGERSYRLDPLAVPAPGAVRASDARTYAALDLFAERARAVDARFTLTDDNVEIVADICRRLDGIAFAIELAASRVRVLSVRQLREKLAERFRVLTGGSRADVPRRQTLLALIDWSYGLLSEDERRMLRRLGTFSGSWTLEAAVEIAAGDAHDEFDVIDRLGALVDKSLVGVEGDDDHRAYRLAESTRAFARLRLDECGESDDAFARHARYALHAAEALDAAWPTTATRAWERRVADRVDDIRGALARARERDAATWARTIAAMRWFWVNDAPAEGRDALEAVFARPEVFAGDDSLTMRLELTRALVAARYGDRAAQLASAQRAIALARANGARLDLAIALRTAGQALGILGRDADALAAFAEALAVATAIDARRIVGQTHDALASFHLERNDLPAARASLDVAQRLAVEMEYDVGILFAQGNLAVLAFAAGESARALELIEAAATRTYAVRETVGIAQAWTNWATFLIALERYADARPIATTALRLARETPRDDVLALALQAVAALLASDGNHAAAACVLAFVDRVLDAAGYARFDAERTAYDRLCATLAAALSQDERDRARTAGRALQPADAVALATLPA